MDEPINYCPSPPPLKEPPGHVYHEFHNVLKLDDKDEFFRLIKLPEFEPMREHRRDGLLFLRDFFVNMILKTDSLKIALAVLSGEAKGIIDDDQLVFKNGWTPLHLASATPSPKLINYLIQRGDPVDVPCDFYAPLNLNHATPLEFALEVINTGYRSGRFALRIPWDTNCSIFELLHYVCEWQKPCLEVIRLLVQNTQDRERVRKAFFDYADEGKLVKLAALFLAAPELFLSSSLGGGSMSSIDALYLKLNSLDNTTDIQDGLMLLLDVFDLVGHKLIAYIRVNDPKVWQPAFYARPYKIGFFLREAAHKKLGISSRDDYLLSLFKPFSQHLHLESYLMHNFLDHRLDMKWKILPFEMKRKDIDIDYVNRMIPKLEPHEAVILTKAVDNKLSSINNAKYMYPF